MPRTVVAPLPHDLAVKAALETTGKPVEIGRAPEGALAGVLNRTGPDYVVIWPENTVRDGSLADPYADATFVYRLTIVGRQAQGVRDLLGDIEPALLGATVADRVVTHVEVEFGAVTEDRDVGPPHPVYATPTVRLSTTPA